MFPLAAHRAFPGNNLLGDELGLLVIARHRHNAHRIPSRAGGAQDFLAASAVVLDQAVGRVEHRVSRAVVFL